jgi:hypothetical protein
MQYNDATTVSANTHLPMDTTEYLAAAGVGVFNVTGGSRRMDVDYRSNHASWAAKIRQVHLALLPLDAGYPDLQITTTSLPDGAVGAAYNQALAATGGLAPYSWSMNGGSLPSGLSLSSGGVISGTPTSGGTSNFTVRATDSQGTPDTDDQALSITVTAPSTTYEFTASDTEANTTSTTYQTKATLSFTSSITDDWVILSFAEYKGSSESYSTYVRTVVDGTTESEILGEPNDATDYMSYSSVKVRNLAAGAHTITVQYRSENAAATARIRNARVVAIRKASLDVQSTASDSVVALTTTLTDRATLTFTPASAGDYLIIWSAEISANTGYSTRIQANVPVGTWDEGWVESKDNTDYFPWMSFAIYGVPASSTTFRVTAAKETGSTATHNIQKARIVAIRLDGRFADYEAGSSDSEATTTSTSFVEKYTKSWTAGPNGNWLILNSARIAGTAANYSIEARVHLNDATVLAQPLLEPDDTTDYMNFVSVDVRNLTTPRKVDVDYRSENASMTAKIRYVRFAGLSLDD